MNINYLDSFTSKEFIDLAEIIWNIRKSLKRNLPICGSDVTDDLGRVNDILRHLAFLKDYKK